MDDFRKSPTVVAKKPLGLRMEIALYPNQALASNGRNQPAVHGADAAYARHQARIGSVASKQSKACAGGSQSRHLSRLEQRSTLDRRAQDPGKRKSAAHGGPQVTGRIRIALATVGQACSQSPQPTHCLGSKNGAS